MLRIGEFSKLSRVSIRMLRHYDDIGLLKPAEIDQFTGYRYYSPEQLPVIGRITALKDMGFSLADIVKMLEIYENRDELDDYLMKRQLELQEISETTQRQMRLLDTARERL
jgi:DNA-binding transcriptional MerR regulator